GFHFSGARRLAIAESDGSSISRVISDVTTAKVIFSAVLLPVFTLVLLLNFSGWEAYSTLPSFVLIVLSFGFSPAWYYVGRERLLFPAMFDLAVRVVGLVLIVALVRSPDDFLMSLAIMAAIGTLNTLVPTVVMFLSHGCD